jgi:hypothetical protein
MSYPGLTLKAYSSMLNVLVYYKLFFAFYGKKVSITP